MQLPAIVLNLKAYPEATGTKAEALVRIAKECAQAAKKTVIVCPQNPELALLAAKYPASRHFSVFSQHVDGSGPGAFTGSISADTLLASAVKGSLLNHAEKKVGAEAVGMTIGAAKAAGLDLIVCADSVGEARKIAAFHPPCVAIEPPELISKGISVSTARPEVVTDGVEAVRNIDRHIAVLVGAGVSTAEDVAKSLELGAQGVLLASAFVKSPKPGRLLDEMLSVL